MSSTTSWFRREGPGAELREQYGHCVCVIAKPPARGRLRFIKASVLPESGAQSIRPVLFKGFFSKEFFFNIRCFIIKIFCGYHIIPTPTIDHRLSQRQSKGALTQPKRDILIRLHRETTLLMRNRYYSYLSFFNVIQNSTVCVVLLRIKIFCGYRATFDHRPSTFTATSKRSSFPYSKLDVSSHGWFWLLLIAAT